MGAVMIIGPQGSSSESISVEAFAEWSKTAVGRRVHETQTLWSVRHVGKSRHAFELELANDTAVVWLSSTEDEIVRVDWNQRPRLDAGRGVVLIDAYYRFSEAGLNLACIANDLRTELENEALSQVREAFGRGVSRSIVSTLRELVSLGDLFGEEAEKIEQSLYDFVNDDRDAYLRSQGTAREGYSPKPPSALPQGLRELSPTEQGIYELMVEGTLPGHSESEPIRPGPFYRWERSRERVYATYGQLGAARSVGFSGEYRVRRYADGRRCVVERGGYSGFIDGATLSYWVDFFERQSREAVGAIADVEEIIPSCIELPPDLRAEQLAAIPRRRASALKALYELLPRLLDETASERRLKSEDCLPWDLDA
jgi:hypothetical protein